MVPSGVSMIAPAGVLVLFARRDKWLDANHSFAPDFGFTAIAIGDQPVTPQQLHWRSPQIAYGYGISKKRNVHYQVKIEPQCRRFEPEYTLGAN